GEIGGPRVVLNDGHGALRVFAHLPTPGSDPVTIGAGDFNRDGLADIVSANLISSNVVMHLNVARAEFVPTPVTLPTGDTLPQHIGVADLNGDGAPDIALADAFIDSLGQLRADVRVFLNTTAPAPCAADFNGDGRVNSQDVFDFLSAFFASSPSADFNADGAV